MINNSAFEYCLYKLIFYEEINYCFIQKKKKKKKSGRHFNYVGPLSLSFAISYNFYC